MRWDDEYGTAGARRRWKERREDHRPGRIVSWADEGSEPEQVDEPLPATLRITNRDLATYLLATGVPLVSLEHQAYGSGWAFVMDDSQGQATAGQRRWWGRDGGPMVDARDYAGAGALVRRLFRDGLVPGEPIVYSGGSREHGREQAA